ncbi:MAG: AAA family ATPase [Candidatus Omnitrophica bacterium]|nr:AAA family ATPase [Candidatus Omnitrophota bacterium]
MYFKKLEIFGFKSFAEKTALNFEPGITAIVGPNGCGKSNIFDAIRWVLGEQSVKELRGSSMEDVIFNGTDKKSSLGFAEVSLTFSNESRKLNIEYDEVTVTRRLFRSGESEYLLNKSVVRLKDIQELLMGTGIGAEAYSLVQQGKVDLVVSAKPEDRRMILDEASGITKYKAKKREALNKLRDTDNNLLRVNDIVIEVKRQIGSTERQANKARKYKEEFEKLKVLEIQLAVNQIQKFVDQKEAILNEIQELKSKEIEFSDELEELTNGLNYETSRLAEVEQKINELRSEEIKLESQIDLNNRQIGFNHERIENALSSSQKLQEQKRQLISRCNSHQEKIQELKQSLSSFDEKERQQQEILTKKRQELNVVEKAMEKALGKIREHEENTLSLTSNQVAIRNALTEVMKEMQGADARQRRLEIEKEKILKEQLQISQRMQNIEYQIISIKGSIASFENRKDDETFILTTAENRISKLERLIQNLEKKNLFLTSQKDFIEKMRTQYQDMPDPSVEGRFYTYSTPEAHHTGIIGKVKAVNEVDPNVVFRAEATNMTSQRQPLYEIICETKFIELDPQQISKKMDVISEDLITLNSKKDQLFEKFEDQQETIKKIDEEIFAREKKNSVLMAQKNDTQEEIRKLDEELSLVNTELKDVEQLLSSSKVNEEQLNEQLDSINQDIGWFQIDIKDKQEWISVQSKEKERKSIAIAQLETELASLEDKKKGLEDNLKMFDETMENWKGEIKNIDEELSKNESQVEQFKDAIEDLEEKIIEVKENKEVLFNIIADSQEQKDDITQRMNSVRSGISSLEDQVEDVRHALHDQQMKEQAFVFNEKGVRDRLLQTYKIDLEQLSDEQKEQSKLPENFDLDESHLELDRLRKRCESFGNVNLVAIDEYEEMKERFEFLTKQQVDLIEAKSQLMNTITKINKSTKQMFLDTFTKVGEEFRIYFRMLFGGGEAQLVLLDPENVLESGIEIIARPPGKKLQNISLLSGGEKTLTAIALIFGVFKVNPSPFCVLDEIDAALDESNVGRFSYLLQDFAKIAQFIVITHNKKTIASSNVMYGITMPETGVSRIVSVKLSKDEKKVTEEVHIPAAV